MLPGEFAHPVNEGETCTTTWYDSWRFVDGKADEHWDPGADRRALNRLRV